MPKIATPDWIKVFILLSESMKHQVAIQNEEFSLDFIQARIRDHRITSIVSISTLQTVIARLHGYYMAFGHLEYAFYLVC